MTSLENLIGYIAAVCTTIAYVPQVLKVYKTKSTHDISLTMFLLMVTGITGWLIYGLLLNAMPIIIANLVSFALAFYIFYMKLKDFNKERLISKRA